MAFYTKRLKIVAIIPFCSQECPVYFSNPLTQYLKGKDSQVILINLIFEVSAKMHLQPLFFLWLAVESTILIITVFS